MPNLLPVRVDESLNDILDCSIIRSAKPPNPPGRTPFMLATITDFLWSYVLVFVLVAIGVTFTVASRFVQFRYFIEMFRVLGQAFKHEPGRVSSFQALTLSVAGRVGAGNIAGVAVAITLGGPGAVFWMWVIGLIGMATSFFECSIAQAYKTRSAVDGGAFRGGPAHYITRGIGSRGLAMVFSLLLLVTFGLAFVGLQSFVASSSLEDAFGIPTAFSGIALTAVVGLVIFGGVRRMASVTEILVPLMAVAYILVALVVVAFNFSQVPDALMLIVRAAFGLEEAVAGGIGAAIMMGVRRGLFSNEAGLGSAPNVAAVAWVPHPVNQGIVQALSVFIDTAIICTCTAFLILMSGVYVPDVEANGVVMTQAALSEHVGDWGRTFVSCVLLLFAFSSILYNAYLGENSLSFFWPGNQTLFNTFRAALLALILWGSVQDLSTVFAFADLTMALLALVNLAALALLFKVGLRLMRDYDEQSRAGKVPVFDPARFPDLNIDADAWSDAGQRVEETDRG